MPTLRRSVSTLALGAALTLAVVVALVAVALLVVPALIGLRVLLLGSLAIRRALLLRLVHRVQDTEIMFRMLKERLCCDPVAAAGGVPAKLEVFLKKLLRRAADADFRAVAVEDVVAVERHVTARVVAHATA